MAKDANGKELKDGDIVRLTASVLKRYAKYNMPDTQYVWMEQDSYSMGSYRVKAVQDFPWNMFNGASFNGVYGKCGFLVGPREVIKDAFACRIMEILG